jgi:radical SAM protein with 4Fe4S-binding SPASM domain
LSTALWSNLGQALHALVRRRVVLKADAIPYVFTNVPARKTINAILTEASVYFKPRRSLGMPTHLMVEPSAHCNLACALCPVTKGLDRPQGHMDLGLFKKLLDETGDYLFTLLLWDWGEPFVNPRIFDMIAYARGKGVKTISSTNGHLFAKPDEADKLVRSGLDTIIFAIDGITQATYERYRQGGQLATALEGVRTVAARKKALQSATPLINFRFIVMAHNEHEIPAVKELAPSLGADVLTFKTLNPRAMDPYGDREEEDPGKGAGYLPRNTKYWRFRPAADGRTPQRLRRNPCRHLWNHPTVHWDGTVCPCEYDPREKYPLGSMKNQNFREIWNGEAYRRLRGRFRSGWQEIPLCSDCSYAYQGGNCSRETIAEAVFYARPR